MTRKNIDDAAADTLIAGDTGAVFRFYLKDFFTLHGTWYLRQQSKTDPKLVISTIKDELTLFRVCVPQGGLLPFDDFSNQDDGYLLQGPSGGFVHVEYVKGLLYAFAWADVHDLKSATIFRFTENFGKDGYKLTRLNFKDTCLTWSLDSSVKDQFPIPLRCDGFDIKVIVEEKPLVSGCGAHGRDFSGMNFSHRFFYQMVTEQTIFEGADLRESNFMEMEMTEVILRKALLNNVRFSMIKLRNILSYGDLSQASCPGTNFSGTYMECTNLSGIQCSPETVFKGADIRQCNFQGAQLIRVDFSGMNLGGSNFSGASLAGANFAGAKLQQTNFVDANLEQANFSGADLTGAFLSENQLNATDFTNAIMVGTDFSNSDLLGSIFSDNPIFGRRIDQRTRFQNAKIHYALIARNWSYLDLTHCFVQDLPEVLSSDGDELNARFAIIDNMELQNRTLSSGAFDSASLRGTNLAHARVHDASFKGALLNGTETQQGVTFSGADLFNCDFSNAQMSRGDFSCAMLQGGKSTLAGATIADINFSNAYLANINFSNVHDLRGANFTNACLVNTNFIGTTLTTLGKHKVIMTSACLQGADFSDASLYGVNLVDAAVATQAGKLKATIFFHGERTEFTHNYKATTLPDSATNDRTVCPNASFGPCAGEKLVSPRAPMHEWQGST